MKRILIIALFLVMAAGSAWGSSCLLEYSQHQNYYRYQQCLEQERIQQQMLKMQEEQLRIQREMLRQQQQQMQQQRQYNRSNNNFWGN